MAVWLDGEKLHGGYALIRTHLRGKDSWLFFKMKDDEADPEHIITQEQTQFRSFGKIGGRK